jgi:hypothetical protein
MKDAQKLVQENIEAIAEILDPLLTPNLVDAKTFLDAGVIRQEHYDSLHDEDWAGDGDNPDGLESCKYGRMLFGIRYNL